MKKILLLLLFFSTSLLATSQYTILVNTAQEVPMYAELFDAIHLFFHGTTGQNYLSLLKLIVMFGTIVTLVRATTAVGVGVGQGGNDGAGGHSSLIGLASYQIFIVAMLMILFARECTLIIKHPQSLRTEFTATVPEVFGYTISFFSQLNYKMVEISEDAFSNLRNHGTGTAYNAASANKNISYGLTGLGYGGLASNLANVGSINANNLTYKDGTTTKTIGPQLRVYGTDCVIMPLANSNADAIGAIMNTEGHIIDEISPTSMLANFGIDTSSYLTTYNGATTTCTDFWTVNLKPALDKTAANMYVRYGKEMAALFYTMKMANVVDSSIDAGPNGMIGDVAAMQEQIFNAGVGNTFNSIFNDLGTAGNVFATGMQQNLMEQNMMNWGTGRAMAEYLPVFASFLFMIMIAAFPFMFAFSLMPGGISIMVNFVKTLAWISLWAPMAAILNFFLDYRLTEHLIERSGNGTLNLVDGVAANFQLFDVTSEAAMMANLAGGLYVMVPALSWMLVTGSGTMLTGITNGLAASVAGSMNMQKLEETAIKQDKFENTNSMTGLSYAEQKHYEMAQKSAAESSAIVGNYANYKGSGGALSQVMTNDMSVAAATQVASQRSMGANLSMENAVAGGEFQGAMKAGSITGQAMALSSYDGNTGAVARTGAMESFGSAMVSKGKADEMNFGSVGQSSYNAGIQEGSKQNRLASSITTAEARDAGTVSGAQEAGNIKALAGAVADADNIQKGTQIQNTKQLSNTAEVGANGSLKNAKKSGKLQGMRDVTNMEADAQQLDSEIQKEGSEAKVRSKLKAAASKKLADEFGAAEAALGEEAAINSGEYQEAARKKTKQDMLQTKKTYGNNGVTDKEIEKATDTTSAQAKGAIQGQSDKAGNAALIQDTTRAETGFNIEKQMQSFSKDGKVLDSKVLNAAATFQGGQAVGNMMSQAKQLKDTYHNNKDSVIADSQINSDRQIIQSHADAIALRKAGYSNIRNFATLTAGKQITAPIQAMNSGIHNGYSIGTQIDDTAQNIYLQTGQAHGSANSVRLHGVNGAANAAEASTSGNMLLGSLMGAKGSGLGGPESVAKTQAISQSSNIQSQAAAQAALFEQNGIGKATLENMAGVSGAQAAASGRLEALKDSNNIKDIQATADKNFADFQSANPAMGTYAQMKMGRGHDAIAKYASINNMQSTMSIRGVDDLGMNHTITNNAFGRQGTSMHSGGKGMDWKASTNVDSAHMLAAEQAEAHGGTSGLFAASAIHNAGESVLNVLTGSALRNGVEQTMLRNTAKNHHGEYEGSGPASRYMNNKNSSSISQSKAEEAHKAAQNAKRSQNPQYEAGRTKHYGNGSGHNVNKESNYPSIITDLRGF